MKIVTLSGISLVALIGFIPIDASTVSSAESPQTLDAAWNAYRRTAQEGTTTEAVMAASALKESAQQSGIDDAPELSAALVRDAERLVAAGDISAAIAVARVAVSLSPASEAPHALLARILWKAPDVDTMGSLHEWIASWKMAGSDFWVQVSAVRRGVAAIGLALLSATLLMTLVLAGRSIPLVAHLIGEWSNQRLFRPTTWLMAILLLLAPFVAGIWAVGFVLAPMAVVWWFLSRPERLMVAALAALGLVVSVFLPAILWLFMVEGDPMLHVMADLAAGRALDTSFERLSPEMNDPVAAAVRGMALVRLGREAEAAAVYEDALAQWPDDPRLLTNFGNLQFRRQAYDQAIGLYLTAEAHDPHSVAVLYNLSQAYRAALHFPEGESRYQAARAIDAGLLDAYAERGRANERFLVVDYGFTGRELWLRALTPRAVTPTMAAAVDRLTHIASVPFAAGFVALLTLYGMLGHWAPNRPAVPCAICSRAVCRHCQRYFLDFKLCSSCWKVYAKGVKLQTQATLPQIRQRWKVRRRFAMLLSVIPGAGHVSIGRPFTGLVAVLTAAGLVWWGWLTSAGWQTFDARLFAEPWYLEWLPVFGVLFILYVWTFRHLSIMDPIHPTFSSRGRREG